MRNFKVGDICVHKNCICRVKAVTPDPTKPLVYNPTLTLTALYGVDGEPVKNAKDREAISGNVEYAAVEIDRMTAEIALMEKRIKLLRSL